MATVTKERLAQLLEELRNKRNNGNNKTNILQCNSPGNVLEIVPNSHDVPVIVPCELITTGIDKSNGAVITYNQNQATFVDLATEGNSCVLIGAAGSGKTTCMRGVMQGLIQSGNVGLLDCVDHKHLHEKTPGIVIVSFTRRAVANIRRAVAADMKQNCLTIHALLEYEPTYYEIFDASTGAYKRTMQFLPTRSTARPLSDSIKVCVIEESSMVSTDQFALLKAALPHNCQFIFLGDIQQLPPVFGDAILGYKMLELPVIELTEIYRQALESPIIRLAHRILSGEVIPAKEYPDWKYKNQLTLHPWKKSIDADNALNTLAKFLTTGIDQGLFNPDEDMVLIPYNKACGTIELNKHIAQHMARKRGNLVWEVIAGYIKNYFAVGDKILYDKEDAVITDIAINPLYAGSKPQPEGKWLDYWGYNCNTEDTVSHGIMDSSELSDDEVDFMLNQAVGNDAAEERTRQASHIITIKILETGITFDISSVGEVNALLLAYALTVYKSQGSEFRKVFLLLHSSHNTLLCREMLYTAVTRAREELYVICEPDTFTKGIKRQSIKGNTLEEKAEFFKGKIQRK